VAQHFRMNQKQLEAAVRKAARDESLDPRRKAYLMQNLMTRYPLGCCMAVLNLKKRKRRQNKKTTLHRHALNPQPGRFLSPLSLNVT